MILVAVLAVWLGPESWHRFAYVALGVGFGGLLARWLPLRPDAVTKAEAPAPTARPFVYQAAPPPWESSTSLQRGPRRSSAPGAMFRAGCGREAGASVRSCV